LRHYHQQHLQARSLRPIHRRHHCRKRLAESRALMAERTRDERQRKEQRRQEKEAAKLHQQ
jgi:hypothetical protein